MLNARLATALRTAVVCAGLATATEWSVSACDAASSSLRTV